MGNSILRYSTLKIKYSKLENASGSPTRLRGILHPVEAGNPTRGGAGGPCPRGGSLWLLVATRAVACEFACG